MDIEQSIPTISDDFYMTVSSKATLTSNFNKINNFTVNLPLPIRFSCDFEVSICDFIFPIKWNYLNSKLCELYVKVYPTQGFDAGKYSKAFFNDKLEHVITSTIKLEDGWFLGGQEFAEYLNASLGTIPKTVLSEESSVDHARVNMNLKNHLHFSYSNASQKFNVEFTSNQEYISLRFNLKLGELLGITSDEFIPKDCRYAGEKTQDSSIVSSNHIPRFFENHRRQMHITCEEVEPEFIFDRFIELLTSIHLGKEVRWTEGRGRNEVDAQDRKYKKLKTKSLHSLHFAIFDSDFIPFPFITHYTKEWEPVDEVILNLHFRPVLFNQHS